MNNRRTNIFVGNLSLLCHEELLRQKFTIFNYKPSVAIISDSETNKFLSYGFVTYQNPAQAYSIMRVLNGELFLGRNFRQKHFVELMRFLLNFKSILMVFVCIFQDLVGRR